MGVKKLLTYLLTHQADVSEEVVLAPLPSDSPSSSSASRRNVVVDGSGFLIELTQHVYAAHPPVYPDDDVVGGSLPKYVEALKNIITNLRDTYGVELVFASDGARGLRDEAQLRDLTLESRAKDRRADVLQVVDYCRGASPFKAPPHKKNVSVPLPKMIFRQLSETMNQMGVKRVVLDDEVDCYIGRLIHDHDAFMVITSDTDLVVTPGVPVVFTQKFPYDLLVVKDCKQSLTLNVFTNERLASHLELSEDELLLAASLAGNDVTSAGLPDSTKWPGIKKSADQVKANRDASEDEEELFGTLVMSAVESYKSAAIRKPYAPTLTCPKQRAKFELYAANGIPIQLMSNLRTDEAMPMRHGEFGFVQDLHTFRRLHHAALHMAGRTSEMVIERGTSEANPKPKEVLVDLDQETLDTLPLWEPTTTLSPTQLASSLEKLCHIPSGKSVSLLKAKYGSTMLIMWAMHSGLESENELQRVAEMIVILRRALIDKDPTAIHVLDSLPVEANNGAVLGKRPDLRTLEIGSFLSMATGDVSLILNMLHLSEIMPPPEPQYLFSGALLHTLNFLCPKTPMSSSMLADNIGGKLSDYSKLLSEVSTLMVEYHTLFPIMELRGESGVDDVRHIEVVRCSWVGLLQRDEMLDFIEGGATGNNKNLKSDTTKQIAAKKGALQPTKAHDELEAGTAKRDQPASDALPIEEHMEELLATIANNRVVCLQGDTGCGKSSMIPLHVYLDAKKKGKKVQIIVTQPRRLAAVALANRVASLLGEEVGGLVGYRLGGGAHKESSSTCIHFVTSGYLIQSLVHGGNLWGRASHIILDEVHERSLDADMLSLVLRLMLQHDDDSSRSKPGPATSKRLVVMSATIQSELFMEYFQPLTWDKKLPPLMRVGGHRRHVTTMYLPEVLQLLQKDIPADTMTELTKYLTRVKASKKAPSLQPSDIHALCHVILACVKKGTCILVFLPGLKEIEDSYEELSSRRTQSSVDLRVHALHSIVDAEEQQQVLVPSTDQECKIVLSTNIAETSITIPDVKVVIDMGFSRRMEYDQSKGLRCIVCGWCSKAAARQRAGRAGRVTDGLVLRMYPEENMTTLMPDFDGADFYPLESSVLQVREGLGAYGEVAELMAQLVEPPPPMQVTLALERLVEWGALGPAPDYDILSLGRLASSLPIDVSLTKAITSAAKVGCAADMAVIACGLMQQRPLFKRPMRTFFKTDYEFQQHVAHAWRGVCHFDRNRVSDVHAFLSIMEERSEDHSYEFCEKWYLSFKQIRTFALTARLLAQRLHDAQKRGLLVLDTEDAANILALSKSGGKIRFPSLRNALQDELLQVTLTQAADRMLVGGSGLNNEFKAVVGNVAPSTSSSPQHTVIFDGVSREIQALPVEMIKAKFAAFGSVRSCTLSASGGKKKIITTLIVEMNPDAPSSVAASSSSSSSPVPVHGLLLPASITAICRYSKMHSSHSTTLACSNVEQGMPFPNPQANAKVRVWRVVPRLAEEDATVINMERWSIIGSHASGPRSSDPSTYFGFAFGVIAGGNSLFATNTFILRDTAGLALLSILCAGNAGAFLTSVDPFSARFEPVLKASEAWSAPITALLMANIIRLLQGPKCKALKRQTQLIVAYETIRDITNQLSKAYPTSRKSNVEAVEILPMSINGSAEDVSQRQGGIFDVSFLEEFEDVLGGNSLWKKALGVYNKVLEEVVQGKEENSGEGARVGKGRGGGGHHHHHQPAAAAASSSSQSRFASARNTVQDRPPHHQLWGAVGEPLHTAARKQQARKAAMMSDDSDDDFPCAVVDEDVNAAAASSAAASHPTTKTVLGQDQAKMKKEREDKKAKKDQKKALKKEKMKLVMPSSKKLITTNDDNDGDEDLAPIVIEDGVPSVPRTQTKAEKKAELKAAVKQAMKDQRKAMKEAKKGAATSTSALVEEGGAIQTKAEVKAARKLALRAEKAERLKAEKKATKKALKVKRVQFPVVAESTALDRDMEQLSITGDTNTNSAAAAKSSSSSAPPSVFDNEEGKALLEELAQLAVGGGTNGGVASKKAREAGKKSDRRKQQLIVANGGADEQ